MQAIHCAGGARPTFTLFRTLKIQFPANNILLLKKKKKKDLESNKCIKIQSKNFYSGTAIVITYIQYERHFLERNWGQQVKKAFEHDKVIYI